MYSFFSQVLTVIPGQIKPVGKRHCISIMHCSTLCFLSQSESLEAAAETLVYWLGLIQLIQATELGGTCIESGLRFFRLNRSVYDMV